MHENLRTDFEVFGLLEFIVVVVILYDVLNVVLIMEIGRFLAALLGDGLLRERLVLEFASGDDLDGWLLQNFSGLALLERTATIEAAHYLKLINYY